MFSPPPQVKEMGLGKVAIEGEGDKWSQYPNVLSKYQSSSVHEQRKSK